MSDATSTDRNLTTDQRLAVILRAVQRIEQSQSDLAREVAVLRASVPTVPGPSVGERLVEGVRGLRSDLAASVGVLGVDRTANNERVMQAVSEVGEELEHVLEGHDALRDELRGLASRSATADQITEVAGELRRLLAEIEAARRQAGSVPALPAPAPTSVEHDDFPEAVARRLRRLSASARERTAKARARSQTWP